MYRDINDLIQKPGEATETFLERKYNVMNLNFKDAISKKKDSPEDHIVRFWHWFNLDQTKEYYLDRRPLESEDEWLGRWNNYCFEKKKIIERFDDKIYNSLKRKKIINPKTKKNEDETLHDWLDRVNRILLKNEPFVFITRNEFETTNESVQRFRKFSGFRDDILVQIQSKAAKDIFEDKIGLSKAQEEARLDAREEKEFIKNKREQEISNDIKLGQIARIKFSLFLLPIMFLLFSFILITNKIWIESLIWFLIIFGGIGYLGWYLLRRNDFYDICNNNKYYNNVMDFILIVIKIFK